MERYIAEIEPAPGDLRGETVCCLSLPIELNAFGTKQINMIYARGVSRVRVTKDVQVVLKLYGQDPETGDPVELWGENLNLKAGGWFDFSEIMRTFFLKDRPLYNTQNNNDFTLFPPVLLGWWNLWGYGLEVAVTGCEPLVFDLSGYVCDCDWRGNYFTRSVSLLGDRTLNDVIDLYGDVEVAVDPQTIGATYIDGPYGWWRYEQPTKSGYTFWQRLSGDGRWGVGQCGNSQYCDAVRFIANYSCKGPLEGEADCFPKGSKKTMGKIQYIGTDGVTIKRWCEISKEADIASQTERKTEPMYPILPPVLKGYRTYSSDTDWHEVTRNINKHFISVKWTGFPAAERKRIAQGIVCSPLVLLELPTGEHYAATINGSYEASYDDGGELEFEFLAVQIFDGANIFM